MYCPKCGTSLPDDAKFCRSCGADLEIVSDLLSDSSRAEMIKAAFDGRSSLETRKKHLQNIGALIIMLSLVIGAAIPLVIGLGYENSQSLIMILAGLAGILLFGGISVAIFADFDPKPIEVEKAAPKTLPPAEERQLSEGHFESARSVTENTTNLLETDKLKVPRRDAE